MTGFLYTYLAVILAFLVGWIANIIQITMVYDEPITTLVILKLVGIVFCPLGAVLGWVGFF